MARISGTGSFIGVAALLLAAAAAPAHQSYSQARDIAPPTVRFCELSELTPRNVHGLLELSSAAPRLGRIPRVAGTQARGSQVVEPSIESLVASDARQARELGATVSYLVSARDYGSELIAWDRAARRALWTLREHLPIVSPTLVTAGGLLFYGTADGWLKAVDARSGELLWQHQVEQGPLAGLTSYLGPDGHQYLSIGSGTDEPSGRHTFSLPR
jgi:hypothetical protein